MSPHRRNNLARVPLLPTSPMTLVCPLCKAKAGRDCVTSSGGLSLVHVARIKAATAKDVANKLDALAGTD
jgi:hypothetical protein